MIRQRVPGDLTDAHWARLEPLVQPAKTGRRPRWTDMRAATIATIYLLRTGCPLRYLSRDLFLPRSTVYNTFSKFQREGESGGVAHGLVRTMGPRSQLNGPVIDS